MTLLIGSFTIGLILSLLAFGVLITFRIFQFPDITAEGSFTFGASVSAALLAAGTDPFTATTAGFACGALAGTTTGLLHTRCGIHGLLAGILVMIALYSVNLHVMGKSNIPLLEADTFAVRAERFGAVIWGGASELTVSGWSVSVRDASVFVCMAAAVAAGGWLLHAFFRTRLGTAMRATGDNDRMVTALGVNVDAMRVLGLALSNGLVGLSGALLAQYQGFADVQMGIGMMVWGMASVIIGEALTGASPLALQVAGAVIGSVLFRLLVAVALRWGLNPNDLKLITAGFVFVALVSPAVVRRLQSRRPSQQGGPRA